MTHGGSIPGCEFSLPRRFHDGPCPEWQPCSWRQVVGEFPRAGRGTGPGLGAELGNIPHLHAEWLRAVSGALSSVLVLPAFPHTCPTTASAECCGLCCPLQTSCPCALSFPESCQLFIPPSGLCRPGGFLPPHLPGCFPGAAALRVGWLVPISQVYSTRPRFGDTSFVVVLYLEDFLRMSKSLEKGSSTPTGLLSGVKGLPAEQEIYMS